MRTRLLLVGIAGAWLLTGDRWEPPITADSLPLALVGARAFGDAAYTKQLVATLDLAAFPAKEGGGLRFAASNAVGDAVMLYALTLGPMWERARR